MDRLASRVVSHIPGGRYNSPCPTLTLETPTPISPFLACNVDLPSMTILAIGTDVRPGQHRYGLTDGMRAVRVDFAVQ
ncbi:MAG TPA: hypothetical protein VKB04_14245, partial [Anaerolineales bacterium]|nr:hypothetical protein [Anaerolineales bacterium]